MSRSKTVVRLGIATAAVGLAVAAPQGVATADTGDNSNQTAPARQDPPRARNSATPRAARPNGAAAVNPRGSDRSKQQAPAKPERALRQDATAPLTAGPTLRPLEVPTPATTPDPQLDLVPAASAASTPPAAAAIVAPQRTAALPALTQALPALAHALPTLAQPGSVAVGSIRSAVANVLDGGLNWLNGLPSTPVTELMSGALLLVRRNLENAGVAAAPQSAAAGAALVAQTLVVSTLADSGAGSLRQAITDANANPGADTITFSVAGKIKVGSTALPSITGETVIDGTTAPGYIGAKPVIRVDFQNTAGLNLAAGANGSQILGLSLVDASGAGVTIAASGTVLSGDFIGVREDGTTAEANRGGGVLIQSGAAANFIGVGSTGKFTLTNLISGNRGNGITIDGGNDNVVQANYIGTNLNGTKKLGNSGNGIQITGGAFDNLIGGVATNNNNPTNGTFATPPQGNLVSGNCGNGILIDAGATANQLSGNFIGTTKTGSAALGNRKDGVAIVDADGNQLIGTTSLQDPFVYYNVISGNHGNGVRVTNSDHTVVHANFMGIGADNSTAVANRGDGLLVNGTSEHVDAGGEIPLGNVMSGNRRWGMEVAGTSGGVTSFNNFVGQAAFLGAVPNWKGGILVTSSNPGFDPNDEYSWNRIRTSLIGGNHGNGIQFAGNAYGAEVTDTAVGTNYTIDGALPNTGNGIVVGGNSSKIAIGGFQPSVEEVYSDFSVHVGSNRGYGIVFKGHANDCYVFDTRVGLGTGESVENSAQLPNGRGGIFLGWGTSNIQIGGLRDAYVAGFRYFDEIVGNKGNGVTAFFSKDLQLLGNTISGNTRSGVVLTGTTGATIGYPLAGDIISYNGRFGLYATGNLAGTTVQAATIKNNDAAGVRLDSARGITVGGTNPVEPNVVSDNEGWGVLATGWSRGSALSGNFISNNTRGDVNTRFAIGLSTLA